MELLEDCARTGVKINFNQGLDARLIGDKEAAALARIRLELPHFAMDTIGQADAVAKGLKTYRAAWEDAHPGRSFRWRDNKVFVLTNFDTTHEQDLYRVELLRSLGYWPYIMIYDRVSAPHITRQLARWCNNPFVYAKCASFEEYKVM